MSTSDKNPIETDLDFGSVESEAIPPTIVVDRQEKDVDFGDVERAAPPPLTIDEKIALGIHHLRVGVGSAIAFCFFLVNAAILHGLYRALKFDFKMIEAKLEHQRFISEAVIMSLLGATTVQLGAVMFLIAQFLFPKKE